MSNDAKASRNAPYLEEDRDDLRLDKPRWIREHTKDGKDKWYKTTYREMSQNVKVKTGEEQAEKKAREKAKAREDEWRYYGVKNP